ncbi:hypothetical protein ACLOJK_029591 [Asimina triloba]
MALALSREEAHRSSVVALSSERRSVSEEESDVLTEGLGGPSAIMGSIGVPWVEAIEVADVKGDASGPRSSVQAQKEVAYHRGQGSLDAVTGSHGTLQGVEEEASREEAPPTPVRRKVLGATLGKPSSNRSNEDIFRCPFDMEVRALKILGDLLLLQSRGLQETPLNKEGRGPKERMLSKFLPDMWGEIRDLEERIYLIDGCASQAEYRYHVLKEFPSTILEHHHVEDLFGVSRSLKGGGVVGLARAALERVEKIVARLLVGLDAAKLKLEWAEKAEMELLADLDAAKLERDETVDDAKATILAKLDLEHALAETIVQVTSLRLLQFEAETSFYRLSAQGDRSRSEAAKAHGKASELSAELEAIEAEAELLVELAAMKVEVTLLHKEVKPLTELEASRAEMMRLQEVQYKGPKGDTCSQASMPALADARALVIFEYLRSYAYRQREEFERSYYA